MTYTISVAHTLAVITVLIIGLIGLEHAASYLLNIPRALAPTHVFAFFLATSVVTVGASHVYAFRAYGARMEAESEADYLLGDGSTPSLGTTVTTDIPNSCGGASYRPSELSSQHHRQSAQVYASPMHRASRYRQRFASSCGSSLRMRSLCSDLNPLLHKYATKSSFISHFFRSFLKTLATPYSYTPSHERSWALDAPSTAEDERFPVVTGFAFPDAIPTAPCAQPTRKAIVTAAASMPSARKPE
ncbi:hypothetical protein FB451DRAFT_1256162 [Mycena latifolia]|nr:hypothetical protein FB451DRAFT_1256162 [Mycena latifolia]